MKPTSDGLSLAAAGKARAILEKNLTPLGMMASAAGYPQVWARDSMITLLGATLDKREAALACLRTSVETLAQHQSRFGQIPSFVACADARPSWGGMDNNAWFVIGAARYAALSGDAPWRRRIADAVIRAIDWCEAMDHYHSGLLHSPEMCDWADLLANRGHVLYPNVLCLAALAAAVPLLEPDRPAEADRFRQRRAVALAALQDFFWVKPPTSFDDQSHFQVRRLIACHLRVRPFFLPWVDVADYGEHFDAVGNLIAVLADVATPEQAGQILRYIEQVGVNRPYPVQAIYPAIPPGDRHWREYYKLLHLNLPHQYHNGGIWPWVGGLYVAALVHAGYRAKAAGELARLAEANRQHQLPAEWEFNEWLHGRTGEAMGQPFQAWSAGMYLYAHHAVETGLCPGFGTAPEARPAPAAVVTPTH